jgi:hypothetical protein
VQALGPSTPDDEAAREGHRFYLLESQPLAELRLIAEAGHEAERISGLARELVPDERETGKGGE